MAVDIHNKSDLENAFWIGAPAALGTLVMTFQSMVDMFWIGKLGTESVAAVALCGNIINVIFGFSGLLHTGTVAIMARAIGAGDKKEASRTLAHSFLLGSAVGIFIVAAGWVSSPAMIGFFKLEPAVAEQAIQYLQIMLVHLMLAFMLIPMAAGFSAAGDTVTPFLLHSLAVLLNVILDPILIFTPEKEIELLGRVFHPGVYGMGVYGAGLATAIAVGAALLMYFLIAPFGKFPISFPRPSALKLDLAEFWRIVKIGAPSALAMLSRPMSTLLLLRVITIFGSAAVAGFGIAMRWYSVNWILMAGFGASVPVLVGQYLGAKSIEGASRVSGKIIRWGAMTQIVSTALYILLARSMIWLMDDNPETIKAGSDFMIWVVLGFLVSSPGGLAAAAMNGAGDTTPGMIASFAGNWLFKLPLAWLLALPLSFGLFGIWLAMFISLVVEGAMCLAWYYRGKWKYKDVSAKKRPEA